MSIKHSLLIVVITALSTFATRVTPFILFGRKKGAVAPIITYIGRVLPPAVMVILLLYSIREISFSSPELWIKEIVAIGATITIHVIKRNTLVSIIGGTLLYMLLVQNLFW